MHDPQAKSDTARKEKEAAARLAPVRDSVAVERKFGRTEKSGFVSKGG